MNPEVLFQPQGRWRKRERGRERREEGRGYKCESPTVDAGSERSFRLRYRLGFHTVFCGTSLLCSYSAPQCHSSAPAASHLHAPAVIYLCTTLVFPRCHLCAPMELKLFNFVLAALPGSPLPPGSCVLKGHTTLCCMRTFRYAFPAKGSVVLVCGVNWQQADH